MGTPRAWLKPGAESTLPGSPIGRAEIFALPDARPAVKVFIRVHLRLVFLCVLLRLFLLP
jgi:hypothetical protein